MPDTPPSRRLFVAAPLPEAMKIWLEDAQDRYPFGGIRWVRSRNLHLTIHFLGQVAESARAELEADLKSIARQQFPFRLALTQIGPGPGSRKPRMIWVKFEDPGAFEALTRQMRQRMLSYTERPDSREQRPHITLARLNRDFITPGKFPIIQPEEPMYLEIKSLELWESQLSHDGAEYDRIARFLFPAQ